MNFAALPAQPLTRSRSGATRHPFAGKGHEGRVMGVPSRGVFSGDRGRPSARRRALFHRFSPAARSRSTCVRPCGCPSRKNAAGGLGHEIDIVSPVFPRIPLYSSGVEGWVGGALGELLLLDVLKSNGVLSPEDVWKVENRVKMERFTDECKGICQGHEGEPG